MASKSDERFKQNTRMRKTTNRRQTDYVTQQCVRIGGIACSCIDAASKQKNTCPSVYGICSYPPITISAQPKLC